MHPMAFGLHQQGWWMGGGWPWGPTQCCSSHCTALWKAPQSATLATFHPMAQQRRGQVWAHARHANGQNNAQGGCTGKLGAMCARVQPTATSCTTIECGGAGKPPPKAAIGGVAHGHAPIWPWKVGAIATNAVWLRHGQFCPHPAGLVAQSKVATMPLWAPGPQRRHPHPWGPGGHTQVHVLCPPLLGGGCTGAWPVQWGFVQHPTSGVPNK